MSTTNIRKIASTRQAIDYQLYGSKYTDAYRNNRRHGTDRVAALSMDAESTDEFIDRSQALAEAHGRKVEALSLIQSFEKSEMNPDDPEDVQRVNMLGYALAKRMYPDSDVHVVTHIDGRGGHPHNHIVVINHDNLSGRAIKSNTLHWQVARHNDQLMRENALGIPKGRGKSTGKTLNAPDQARYWELERDAASTTEFERQLGDTVQEVLDDPAVVDVDKFTAALADRGIEVVEKSYKIKASADGSAPEHDSIGWTYKMLDETGAKSRMRRRKASSLSDDLTRDGVERTLEEKLDNRAIELNAPDSQVPESTESEIPAKVSPPVVPAASKHTPHGPDGDHADDSKAPTPPPPNPEVVDADAATVRRAALQRKRDEMTERASEPLQTSVDDTAPALTKEQIDAELGDVLRQTSAAYVHQLQSIKGGQRFDELARTKLRWQIVDGELPEDRATAYTEAVHAMSPKLHSDVEKRVKRAWVKEYGEGGDRQGQMSFSQYQAEPYRGRGTGASMSRFKAQQAVKAQKTRAKDTGRGLGD